MTATLTSLSNYMQSMSVGAATYSVSLINDRCNFRKFLEVKADTATEAIQKAKAWNPGYDRCEACSVVKFNF